MCGFWVVGCMTDIQGMFPRNEANLLGLFWPSCNCTVNKPNEILLWDQSNQYQTAISYSLQLEAGKKDAIFCCWAAYPSVSRGPR